MSLPIVVAYGGGTNSTAMLCGFRERGIQPSLVLFADTGAEQPHTYKHVEYMRGIVREWFGLEMEIVNAVRRGMRYTLDDHCNKTQMLPSLAYGKRSCSVKFKHEPMERQLVNWCREHRVGQITKAIGFDANESHRMENKPNDKWIKKDVHETYWYPLVEWGWRREECLAAICRAGLPRPGKSSCYFCPAMKPSEVLNLKDQHPDLYAKAVSIERAAQSHNRKRIGLGGENNLWEDWGSQDNAQIKLLDLQPMHTPCHCTDEGEI